MNSCRLSITLCLSEFLALLLTALLSLTFLSQPAIGQQTLGPVSGTVTDVSGAGAESRGQDSQPSH